MDEVKSAITPRESTAIRRKRGWIAAMAGSGFASYRRGPEVFQTDDKGLGSLRIPAMEASEINGARCRDMRRSVRIGIEQDMGDSW